MLLMVYTYRYRPGTRAGMQCIVTIPMEYLVHATAVAGPNVSM
jgi:hypothetical protein